MAKESWKLEEGEVIAPGLTALDRIGGGKENEAYFAWDEQRMCIVVVKMLRPDKVDSRSALRHIRREASMLERLEHPGLMRGFGAVLDGERPHLVLEHVEGPTLRSLLRHGPLQLEQLLPLGSEIAAVLHYMSTLQIVHLDVKPSNMVMGVPVRLIDMSLARTHADAAELTVDIGTTDYMAPEQCTPGERGTVGAPADVWGLGVVLFEAATGELPFTEGSGDAAEIEMAYPQLVEEPKTWLLEEHHRPPRFNEAVLACLTPEPERRPTAAEVATEFQDLVALLPRKRTLGRRRPRLS